MIGNGLGNVVTWSVIGIPDIRRANGVSDAVRSARRYIRDNLFGMGTATIFVDGIVVRQDERSERTGMRWVYRVLDECEELN